MTDATVERLAVILSQHPRGTLMVRDELAGWLQGMTRYAGGGSDRPFWLEATGGRSYTVERMGRPPVHVDHLSIGVLGCIQPDRLRSLLLKSDDDGLPARFLPFWPDPAPMRRPSVGAGDDLVERALTRLHRLTMATNEQDDLRPWIVPFTDPAQDGLDAFRQSVRAWETQAEGKMLSFMGKLPGLTVRLSLILTYMDWLADSDDEPTHIHADAVQRASTFVQTYAIPMARRAYADADHPKEERAARKLLAMIQEHNWTSFTSRQILRMDRPGLNRSADLNPAIKALIDADILQPVDTAPTPTGGRPTKQYTVNPAVLR